MQTLFTAKSTPMSTYGPECRRFEQLDIPLLSGRYLQGCKLRSALNPISQATRQGNVKLRFLVSLA